MKVIISILMLASIGLVGCSHQESYADTMKEWQTEQDNTQVVALQKQVADLTSELDGVNKKCSQAEDDNKNLQNQIASFSKQNQQLQSELSNRPEQSDIINILKGNQEVTNQYNKIAKKYNELLPMWQQLKRDYIELASALREVVASSNISANITQEYLNLIKPVE